MNSENLQERLKQCRKDKAAIEVLEKELEKQIKENEELKFGDIVDCTHGKRIVLYCPKRKKLRAFDMHGNSVGDANSTFYMQTGKNIFKNNLLGLGY